MIDRFMQDIRSASALPMLHLGLSLKIILVFACEKAGLFIFFVIVDKACQGIGELGMLSCSQ